MYEQGPGEARAGGLVCAAGSESAGLCALLSYSSAQVVFLRRKTLHGQGKFIKWVTHRVNKSKLVLVLYLNTLLQAPC